MNDQYRRRLALLLVAAAVILAAGIGLRDPWPADEPRFALIARDMVASGNWLLPHIGGVLYPDKPPMFFWSTAAVYLLTGSIRVSFLMPGLLAGLGVLCLVSDLGRRLWGDSTGLYCGATLLVMLQFPLQMKSGQIDGLLCLWTTLGLYGLSRHLLLGPDWRWYTVGGAAAGLGVITKGVGFLPYLVLIPWAFAALRGWSVYRSRDARWLLAPTVTALVIAAWLVPMLFATGAGTEPGLLAYRDNILFHQTITRYADSWGHIKPPWYLWTHAAPWLWLPATLLLPWLLPAWARDLKRGDARVLTLLGWMLLVMLFFSMSDGKRSVYIFPAAPAFALLAGYRIEGLLHRRGVRRVLLLFSMALAVLIGLLAAYVLLRPDRVERWLADGAVLATSAAALLITAVAMLVAVLALRRRAAVAVLSTLAIFWLGLSLLLAPALNEIRSGSALMRAVQLETQPFDEVAFVAWPEQFLLQWQRPVTHFGYRRSSDEEIRDAAQWLLQSPGRVLLLPEKIAAPCIDPTATIPAGLAHRRNWLLATGTALQPACASNADVARSSIYRYTPRTADGLLD